MTIIGKLYQRNQTPMTIDFGNSDKCIVMVIEQAALRRAGGDNIVIVRYLYDEKKFAMAEYLFHNYFSLLEE